MISIVGYGVGNVGSIVNMLKRIGHSSYVATSPDELEGAKKVILPGVGSFDSGMNKLISGGWKEILDQKALQEKVPILGVCLGMQLFTKGSDEGDAPGFGWVDAETKAFDKSLMATGERVPHMGWNVVESEKESPLFDGLTDEQRFYFVHSYHVVCNNPADTLTTTCHGYKFTSSFEHNNIIGVQFHPEKSHKFGMEFFRRFAEKY
ncbi:imidazole glycerol phosphate synthase subunit HisH [Pseudomonadota bacterium]